MSEVKRHTGFCCWRREELLFFVRLNGVGMAGTAALEFRMFQAHPAMAAKAGTHGFPAVEGHEAAFSLVASALNGMAALGGTARRIWRLFLRGAVVADGTAGLVMAGIAGNVAVRGVVESDRHAWRNLAAEHDGVLRILEIGLEVLGLCRGTPGEGDEKGKDKKRFHAQSPGRWGKMPGGSG